MRSLLEQVAEIDAVQLRDCDCKQASKCPVCIRFGRLSAKLREVVEASMVVLLTANEEAPLTQQSAPFCTAGIKEMRQLDAALTPMKEV